MNFNFLRNLASASSCITNYGKSAEDAYNYAPIGFPKYPHTTHVQ